MSRDLDPSTEVSSRAGARTLTKVRLACAKEILRFESRVNGDPQVAILGTDIGEDHPVANAHALTLMYYGELEPLMHRKMPGMWNGNALDDNLATVLVPQNPGIAAFSDYEEEVLRGFSDLEEWSMRSVEVASGELGQTESIRLYLSPAAIRQVYRQLKTMQSHLGLDADGKAERQQQRHEIDRL